MTMWGDVHTTGATAHGAWNAVMLSALTQASGKEFHSGTVLTKKRMFILSSM